MRIALQPAFILHHRPFRETSLLLDVFTQEHGRISLVARGVRTHRSKLKAIVQPFIPLLISWQGKGELMNLSSVESQGASIALRGDCLLSAFYINEMLTRVLQKQDPHPKLFSIYKNTLENLSAQNLNQKVLRIFEKNLLEELGYGLQLTNDFLSGKALLAEEYYHYYPDQGFKQCLENQSGGFKGQYLLALANDELSDGECLREMKRLMRLALAPLLGDYELKSKDLFKR